MFLKSYVLPFSLFVLLLSLTFSSSCTCGVEIIDYTCVPGKFSSCFCGKSEKGLQRCNSNGSAYGACQCGGSRNVIELIDEKDGGAKDRRQTPDKTVGNPDYGLYPEPDSHLIDTQPRDVYTPELQRDNPDELRNPEEREPPDTKIPEVKKEKKPDLPVQPDKVVRDPNAPCRLGTKRACFSGKAFERRRGICKDGSQVCLSNGGWDSCKGSVLPKKELCDRVDNDCNGKIDDVSSGFCSSAEAFVQSGSFMMGSPLSELVHFRDEALHKVTLTNSFYIWRYEVTEFEFEKMMSYNPVKAKKCGVRCPIEGIQWHEAALFSNLLSKRYQLPQCYDCNQLKSSLKMRASLRCSLKKIYAGNQGKGYYSCKGYRLPTEAEWEYAARGGTSTGTYNGDLFVEDCRDSTVLNKIGWFCGNSGLKRKVVGQKKPNKFGLYDISGNVYEWVFDGYLKNFSKKPVTDPVSYDTTFGRVIRGGGYNSYARYLRSAFRLTDFKDSPLGFRPVRTAR